MCDINQAGNDSFGLKLLYSIAGVKDNVHPVTIDSETRLLEELLVSSKTVSSLFTVRIFLFLFLYVMEARLCEGKKSGK